MNQFQEHNEFDDFLKGRLSQASMPPPNSQWQRVQKTLFWTRMKRKGGILVSMLVILAVLMQDVYWHIPFRVSAFNKVIGESTSLPKEEQKVTEANPKNTAITSRHIIPSSNKNKLIPEEYSALHSSTSLKGIHTETQNTEVLSSRKYNYKALNPSAIPVPMLCLEKTTLTKENPIVATVDMPKPIEKYKSSIYLGIHGILKNTWIINQNTYNAFKGYEPAFLLDWGHSYGSHLGIKIKRSIWLELSANYFATQGQRYQDVLLGQETYREIDLVYHQFSGVIKKEQPIFLLGKHRSFYWEIGLQYARLLLARQHVNTSDVGVYKRFNQNEISIILGYSVDWNISRRLFINTGIYGRVSNDINAEGWAVDDNYGKSHNADIGFRLGLNYRLFDK